jgi:hypothetical protein
MALPRFRRTDIWREGIYLDLWSVVHLLSGVATALGLALFRFDALAAITIALLAFISYELWEAMVSIRETPQNRVADVVVGIAAFAPAYLSLVPLLHGIAYAAVFALVLVLDIALSTFGWLASRKAAALEAKMRAEYEQRLASFRLRRVARRKRAAARRAARLSGVSR